MKIERNKIIEVGAIAILVAIFLSFVLFARPKSSENAPDQILVNLEENILTTSTDITATSTTSTENKNGTVKKTTPTKTTAPGAVTQSYADALKQYSASGYRFQFVNCRATPGVLTIKKGASFMLDNRDNKAHRIKVGASTYNIGAYSFVIATAKTVGLNYIVCDDAGSGRLQVEP